jgi:manganese/zinc/iron transport system substrate-binding protein
MDHSTFFGFKVVLIVSVCSLIVACSTKQSEQSTSPVRPRIVVTTGMIEDAVKHIVGDAAQVQALMGTGIDPHLYKATQGDLAKLSSATIIMLNGLHLEGKMSEVLEKLATQKPVIPIANGIPRQQLRSIGQAADALDPHIWFDVALWKTGVQFLADTLAVLLPEQAAAIKERSKAYTGRLDSLDHYVRTQIASIPATQRVLITAHDAFGYFGRAYSIEVRALQGISTVSEFGLQDVAQLVDFITQRKIKAVFVESSVPKRSLEAVVAGCQAKGHTVTIGGTLFSDAMGTAGTPEGTYEGMVKANVDAIVSALR